MNSVETTVSKFLLILTATCLLGVASVRQYVTPVAFDFAGREQSPIFRAAPGSVYVVDSDSQSNRGRIVVVDPNAGRVAGGLDVGYQPDFASSADGSRLYVTYDRSLALGGAFEVLDGTSGTVLSSRSESYMRDGVPSAYRSRMALSRDGAWLFRYKTYRSDETGPAYWVEVFDTARNVSLPGAPRLPLCGEAILLTPLQRERLFVVCMDSQDLRIVTFTSDGHQTEKIVRLDLGDGGKLGYYPPAFFSADGDTVTVIKTDGSFIRLSLPTQSIVGRDLVDRVARKVTPRPKGQPPMNPPSPTDWLAGQVIMAFATSPDRSKLFLLTAGRRPAIGRIVVLDTQTLVRIRDFSVTRYYEDIAYDGSGNRIFGLDRTLGELVVLDAESGRELKIVRDVGRGLAFVVVPPS
jgi:hypothetical protein